MKTEQNPKKKTLLVAVAIAASGSLIYIVIPKTQPAVNLRAEETNLTPFVKARFAYKIPDRMEVKQNYRISLDISKSEIDSALYQKLDTSNFRKGYLKISPRIKLSLIDPSTNKNFEINSLNSEEQLIDSNFITVWNWNVSPQRSGENSLVIKAVTTISAKTQTGFKDITIVEKSIQVHASFFRDVKDFLFDNWRYFFAAIVIPLLGWARKNIMKRWKKV